MTNHLHILGTANEEVAEQVGEGHDIEGGPSPPQQGHGGDRDEAAQHRTQGMNTP